MKKLFRIVLIKPSHYDDEGYVIRWKWAAIPSNSLACLYAITKRVQASGQLGRDLDIVIDDYDECNQRIPVNKIIRNLSRANASGIVCMVGVQSNQFPRAVDLSRHFRAAGIPVLIGGFHVSGCLSMLETIPEDLTSAMSEGITLVAGEVEEAWGGILEDVLRGRLKPLYNFLDELPALQDQALPLLPAKSVSRYVNSLTTFDAGRGCPFVCSFCTIINVQGRKSRFRTADDVETIIRENLRQGISRYFITDDDFARNRNWESIFDRIILLRERDGIKTTFILQVDTACHRLPRFIEKAARAGCRKVFIGLENINAAAIKETGKKQNHIEEYREMLQAWHKVHVITVAGYILGFPNDTYESVMRDIDIIKRELPLDLIEFFMLTPLPGSKDHQTLVNKGVWLEPDMNNYDLEHPCMKHQKMTAEEWKRLYKDAWDSFYSPEHVKTLFRRRQAEGNSIGRLIGMIVWYYGSILLEGVHPLQSGIIRRKHRSERRPAFPIENPLIFGWRRFVDVGSVLLGLLGLYLRLRKIRKQVEKDPDGMAYRDVATTPVEKITVPLKEERLVVLPGNL
ncbi:MAG: B12-binding domain-containing radical SAM protein [Nitrospiria bacterium]